MKTKKKFILSKKLYIILSTSLLAITMLALCFGGIFNQKESSKFIAYTDYYKSSQYAIREVSTPNDTNIISMTNAIANGSVSDGYTITISSKEELYNFSTTLNSKENFKGYNYKLTGNIDYEGSNAFVPIENFTGTFDGMGYEIKNLSITSKSSSGYVSMFATNSGVISNFGLVNPNINVTIDDGFVAPICGLNSGEISYTFVRDLRIPEENAAAGMLVNGYVLISGLVYENKGDLHDSYTAYEIVVNRETIDTINQFSEILTIDSGETNNLYFYHGSIESYIPSNESESGKLEIVYDAGRINQTYKLENHEGNYCATLEELNTAVTTNDLQNGWYYSGDYGTLASNLSGIVTPISRGIDYSDATKTFTVNDAYDYSYMYELMNLNATFAAKDITYKITDNINLALIPKENYQYKYAIAATITGAEIPSSKSLAIDTNGSAILYPTIYNAQVDKITTEGIDCYGVFSYVSGTISNLNIANPTINLASSDNILAIGLAVGYLDGGVITNVNTFGDISFNSNIGKFYVGHTAGLAAGGAALSNVTAAGNITNNSGASSGIDKPDYMNGSAIGGILGYATSTLASLNTCLSTINITSYTYTNTNKDIAIGGILGAGYTDISSNLENRGSITVTGNSANLYVAGIIGRHLGLKQQSSHFNNEGNVTVTLGGQTNAMVCGIVNADIITSAANNLAVSPLRLNGRYKYNAAAFTNGAEITINNNNASNIEYTNVLNINSKNGFESEISGIYNLQYNTNNTLVNQNINMNLFKEFAPVVNVNSSNTVSASQKVDASTVYNLRSIDYVQSAAINTATTFNYTGCMIGEYINYTNVRNEGDMTFTLSYAISSASVLNVSGVFDILSNGYLATNIYNGGNISITDTNSSEKLLGINASGILRYNNSVISDDNQSPLSVNFDNSLAGSLDTAINNGKITVTSTNYDKTNVTANNSNLTNLNLKGDINASGIAYQNSGIISNTFNLGDIVLDIYAMNTNSYSAGGIATYQNGQYAQIRDSANNGLIQLINMSLNAATLNAGGIVAKNDLTNTNINQIISFTINYGSIIVFNAAANMELANISIDGAHATAAGILGKGFCNTVNVVNYGNVYCSETAGGMIGIANLQAFSNTSANLANTLNYGNIYAIRKYFSDASQGGNLVYLTYNMITSLNDNYVFSGDQTIQSQYIGAIVSLIQYSTSTVNIRYLINFYRSTAIVARELNAPATTIDTSTFITARGSADTFGGGSIKYAPLSTMEDELGNIGVFSDEFVFYKAIDGIGLDDNYVTDSYIGDYFQFVRFDKVNEHLLDTIGWRSIAYSDAAENFLRNLEALSILINNAGITYDSEILKEAFTSNTWISSCDSEIIENLIEVSLKSGELDSQVTELLNYVLFESSDVLTVNIRKDMIERILEFYKQQDANINYYELLQTLLYDELLAKIVAENNSNYSEVIQIIRDVMSSSENLDTIFSNYLEILKNDSTVLSPLFNQTNNKYYQTKKIELIEKLLVGFSEESLKNIYEKLDKDGEDDNLKYTIFLNNNPQYATNIYANLIVYNSIENNASYLEIINENLAKYNYDLIIGTYNSDNNTFTSGEALGESIDNYANLNGTNLTPTLGITPNKNYTSLWNMIKNDEDVQSFIENNYFQSIKDPTSSVYYHSLLAKATEYNNTYQTQDAPAVITENDGVKVGVYRTESTTGDIKNRFIYTPDSVNNISTYYYGPYDASGIIWNNSNMSTKNPPYNQGYDIYANQAVTGTKKTYFPFFISTNASITENMIAKSNTTSSFGFKPFVWNDVGKSGGTSDKASAGQWVSDYILQKRADDVTALLYKNYNTGEYIVDYYDFSPNKVYHQTGNNSTTVISETATTNYSPINGKNITLSENNEYIHSYTSTGNPNEADFLKGYATSDIITGIWCMFDLWYSGGAIGAYITSKNNGDNADGGYGGIHTTQYTYYQIKDLVALDGVRTKGKNTGTYDSDEVNIISALVQKMLNDTNGKKVILKAIANYSSENNIKSSDSSAVNLLLTSLRGTSMTSDMIINNIDSIKGFNYSNNQTIEQYLDSLNITFDSFKDQILISAVNSQENFKTLLLILLEEIPKYSEFDLQHTTVKDIVYQYLNDKYNIDSSMTVDEIMTLVNNTDAEINADINSATDADLSNMNEIFVLDVDEFIKDSVTLRNAMVAPEIVTYDGVTYNQAITSNNGNATLTFTTGNNYVIHDLLFSGKMILQKNGQNVAESGENTPVTLYTQLLDPNSTYTIAFGNDGKVYSAKFTEQIRNTQTVGPYFTMNAGAVLNLTVDNGDNGTTGFTITNNNTSATLTNLVVTYHLTHTTSSLVTPTRTYKSTITDLSGGSVSPNVLEARGSTESDIVHTYTNNPFTIQVQIDTTNNTTLYDCDVTISNIRLTATYTLSDGTVVTHTQTGFDTTTNPVATSTVTNNNGLSVMANNHMFRTGTTGTFPVNNETTQAPVTFIPFTTGTMSHITSNEVDAVADNFTENYDNISNIGKYLVNDITFEHNTYNSVGIGNPSYVIVKARTGSTGTISFTLGGNTYTRNINSTTDKYYSIYLPNAGTYTISTSNATISKMYSVQIASSINASNVNNTIVKNYADASSNTIAFDYSQLTTFDINDIITSNVDTLTKYEAFLRGYYFIRENQAANIENDIIAAITTLFPTIHQDPNNSSYYSIFLEFSDEELIEIIKLIAVSDYEGTNSVLYKLVNGLDSKYYEDLLLSFDNETVQKLIAEEIYDLANNNKASYEKIVDYILAAYLGNDYLGKLNELTNTKMYTILSTYQGGRYQYITGNDTVDADIFSELVAHLSENSSIDLEGYGIYALSSSKGILNGEFIPDNIVLDDMDSDYEASGNIFKLSDSLSSNWRGGNDSNENDTSNKESVNYAVLVEMKQLKKSIGTTIFEFDLEDNDGVIHYSSESSIDLENGIITYYVPNGYFNNVSKTLTIVEDTISVSNLAQISMMNNLSTDLRKDGNVNTITISNALALEDAIRVIAEDTTVYKDYTIQFVEMNIEFDLIYNSVSGDATKNSDTSATVAYKDGVVILSLTSDTLPQNMDLTPYIDIYQGTTKMDRDTSFALSNEEGDHVINSSHDAIITMEILSSLPAGEYTIVVDIFGIKEELELIKNPSTECDILEFEYDGIDITNDLNDLSHTSYIDFGRAFDYEELTNPTSESFYLNRFKISENATYLITATKNEDSNGLLTYTVTYVITAESGASKTYTHTLIEKHPFTTYGSNGPIADDFIYASYYMDGESIDSLVYNNSGDNIINVEFDRGFEPQYRVKYTLSNFYLLESDMDQLFTIDASGAVGATYNKTYGGITAVVTDTCESGVYTFLYVYNNSGTWSDGDYDRTWEFPAFVITKNYSKDATLNNITYIDGMSMLSSTSTVISATELFRPSNNDLEDNEIDYDSYMERGSAEKDIEAEGVKINYANNTDDGIDYSDVEYTDYFLIGSLSNAKLAYYAPIFKIEEHAEIYQYTTRYKLDNYGKEGYTDMDILTKHTDTESYIYVPYTDGVDIEIFLVELDANNNWTNVYTVESNATGVIATLTENKGSFEYDNKTYTIDESAGKPTNNTSLYMDYIGTPLDDHFWYVSYVVFSEDALHNNDSEYIKYFHLSLIDLTNNIYFEVQVNAPVDFALEDIYITFAAEGVEGETTTKQLSAYVTKTDDTDGEYVIYLLDNEIQILPSGYYYFYLDLPNGYKVTYEITNGKDNRNENENYEGAYLPPSSIVTQRIAITFTIEADEESADIWGVSTSEIYSRVAVEIKE